jgi:hypothetical protein
MRIALVRLMMLALPFVAASAEGQSIRQTAMSAPLGIIATLKQVKARDLAHLRGDQGERIAAFQMNHISLCDFVLSDETHSTQAKRDRTYMLMVFLSSVAGTELQLEHDLAAAGYPETIWRKPLEQLTKAQVELAAQETQRGKSLLNVMAPPPEIISSKKTDLLAALEAFRLQSTKKLPRFEVDSDFCGGDFIGLVNVNTSPAGGIVKLISEYFFQVCLLQKMDPYSDNCNMWLSTSTSDFSSGTYRYLAKWKDSAEECGRIDLIHPGSSRASRAVSKTIMKEGRPCSH